MADKVDPLDSLFAAAIELPSTEQRAEYLHRVCAGDGELRRKVEGLVDAHFRAGEFLESPVAAVAATASLPVIGERAGDQIGPYKLLEQIGEGGMGLVFMAEQTHPLRRRVALKIIKPGLDTRSVIARFEAERQALALMDHPNIARVYDAGATESGRPYFVMELVRGAPITDYCRERSVPLRERLELFIAVCQAVQHAHQKGIIHRDLKPTNILVSQTDTAPVPKVIDFGVAKATASQSLTEKTLFTAFSHIVGTPLYMSPEQADLDNQDIDTRSDVYSLGVVLYELLTGATPFDAARLKSARPDEMRRIIREEEPPRPSTRATTAEAALSTVASAPPVKRVIDASAIKGDLDWIVMKTLEKDRRRRYESPSALAADLARHLASEPVEAFPPMRSYRLWKFVRRNLAALVTAGAIAMALVVGMGISIWQAVRASNAEQRASQALDTAEARLKIARQAVDEMYTQVAQKWLSRKGDLTPIQREFLEKALRLYQRFASENPEDPEAIFDVARVVSRQAEILHSLGDVASAESAYRESIRQFEAALPELADSPSGQFELARSLFLLGQMHHMARRYGDAAPLLQRSLSIMEGLVAAHPSKAEFHDQLGCVLFTIGSVQEEQGRQEDAEVAYRRCHDVFVQLFEESPENLRYLDHLASAELGVAQILNKTGRLEEAKPHYRRALDLLRELVAKDPAKPESRVQLAMALSTMSAAGEVEDNLEVDHEVYDVARGLVDEFPDRPDYLELYVVGQLNYCISLNLNNQFSDALPIARSAVESARRLVRFQGKPDYRRHLVRTFAGLHESLTRNSLQQEAAAFQVEAIRLVRNDPAYLPQLGFLLKHLAVDEYRSGHWRPAIQMMEEAIAADRSEAGLLSSVILALAHARLGDMDAAKPWLERALPLPKPAQGVELDQQLFDEVVEVFHLTAGPKSAVAPNAP